MDLFGKKALRQRIDELKQQLAETQDALARTEDERDRYKARFQEAETAKQEADRARKKAEQRVQTLQQDTDDTTATSTAVLTLDDLPHLVQSLQDTTFTAAHAHTAYLPVGDAVLTDDDRAEILFFDPFTTGVALSPPVPVDHDVTSARTFQLDQLDELIRGPYRYLYLSTDGSGAAIIDNGEATAHALMPDADTVDAVLDAAQDLDEHTYTHTIVSGDDEMVDAFLGTHADATHLPTKVAAVTRAQDLQQAFTAAFTVDARRLTADDIDTIRAALF